MERPSEEEVAETTEKTRLALEKLVNGKIKAAQPKNVPETGGKSQFVRYTPGQGQGGGPLKQRIIKITEVIEDPLEPPRFKHKKIPRGPPSPPAPVLRSPPRKATAQEQKEWMIPPCISNWKNNKGFTIPLDKRLAADGRGLQDVSPRLECWPGKFWQDTFPSQIHINDNFAKFSEALYVSDRHAREEVRQRTLMQQRLAEKEKANKEEHLRMLAQKAREGRTGAPSTSTAAAKSSAAGGAALKSSLGQYGDSESESRSGSEHSEEEASGDDEAARLRDKLRREKRQDREREMRMSNMGTEQRMKQLARSVSFHFSFGSMLF
jgi:SNW domain-containing protein 1